MQLTYIGGTTNNSGASSVSSIVLTYSPVVGNMIVIMLGTSGGVTNLTCVDSNGNPCQVIDASSPYVFFVVATPGVTSYTLSWTTARKVTVCLVEYAGWNNVGRTDRTAITASGLTYTFTVQTGFVDSLLVATIGTITPAVTFTATTGIIRQQVNSGAGNGPSLCIMDNNGGVGIAVTVAGNLSTTAQCACNEVELYPQQPMISAVQADDQWLGGDEY